MTIMFDYTQSKFWGGPWYSYTTLRIISTLGGFFGLDHLWLRSPLSGFLKFIINILTLGLWYFYDLLQIFGEKESVMKNGLGIIHEEVLDLKEILQLFVHFLV